MGEAPVVLDTMLVEQSADELERFLVNKGYIHADVTTRIDTLRHKKAVVTYMLHPNTPYRIRNYQTAISDPVIDSIAHIPPKKRNSNLPMKIMCRWSKRAILLTGICSIWNAAG